MEMNTPAPTATTCSQESPTIIASREPSSPKQATKRLVLAYVEIPTPPHELTKLIARSKGRPPPPAAPAITETTRSCQKAAPSTRTVPVMPYDRYEKLIEAESEELRKLGEEQATSTKVFLVVDYFCCSAEHSRAW